MPVRLEPAAPRSRVKHFITKPLHSLLYPWIYWDRWVYWVWGIVKTQYGWKYMCKIHDNICSFWRIGASFGHTIYNECVCFCLIWFFTSQSKKFQLGLDGSFWCLAARTQCSDAGEARTPNPWVSSQALFYWATVLRMCLQCVGLLLLVWKGTVLKWWSWKYPHIITNIAIIEERGRILEWNFHLLKRIWLVFQYLIIATKVHPAESTLSLICLIWFFTSQSTIFQLCRNRSSWVDRSMWR